MDRPPPVSRASWWLIEGAAWALSGALAYRLLAGIVINPQLWRGQLAVFRPAHLWLLDSQFVTAALLLAALLLLGCRLRRAWEGAVTGTLGAICWLVALSLLPRSLPAIWPTVRLAPWLLWTSGVLAAAAWIGRSLRIRRWRRQIGGHGFAWILQWVEDQPFAARLAAGRVLRMLGWRG